MLKPYLIRNCYSAQISAWAIIGFSVGFTTFGVALWPPKAKRVPWWIPFFKLSLWQHTGQCDQRWLFRLQVGSHHFGYLTVGDATRDLWRFGHAGWSLK